MTKGPAAVLIVEGEELEAAVVLNGGEGVVTLAVYFGGKDGLPQAGADGFRNVEGRYAGLELLNGAVGQCDVDHDISP